MIQKERGIFFGDVQRKRLANQSVARTTEKLRRSQVDFFNVTDPVETDITDWRKIEKIDITLNGRFQCRLGMFEDRSGGRMVSCAVSSCRPIGRKFYRHAGRLFSFLHVFPNQFASGSASRCLPFALGALSFVL